MIDCDELNKVVIVSPEYLIFGSLFYTLTVCNRINSFDIG